MATPTTSSNLSNGAAAAAGRAGQQAGQGIKDALRTLDDAISKQGVNLRDMVSDDYSGLKGAIGDMAPGVAEAIRQGGTQAYQAVQDFAQTGLERSRDMAGAVDKQVRSNPWPVIGGVAVGSLVLGIVLGRSLSAD
jgi:ElaB/YqjD/DUF883 family membrane-anchored ribosome-binding protein